MHVQFLVISTLLVQVLSEICPSGGQIYSRGLSETAETEVSSWHNYFRLQIANDSVLGQPMGTDLRKMKYDRKLGETARVVSDSCKIKHILGTDDRWPWIGQNLYMQWSSRNTTTQNWKEAVTAWFVEHNDFQYPNVSAGVTGHYTQLVWATTDHLGCDFINFFDNDPLRARNPYAKLYSCNYGPGGNIRGRAPYQTGGVNRCPDLC